MVVLGFIVPPLTFPFAIQFPVGSTLVSGVKAWPKPAPGVVERTDDLPSGHPSKRVTKIDCRSQIRERLGQFIDLVGFPGKSQARR